jgi:hypothetical protein
MEKKTYLCFEENLACTDLCFCQGSMVMEYGVLQHVRQSRFGTEGMFEDYAISVLLQRG